MRLIVIRIAGLTGIDENIKYNLDSLRLRKKYCAILIDDNPDMIGMIKKVTNVVAYGEIDKDTLKHLILKRGRVLGDKLIDEKKVTESFINDMIDGKKRMRDIGAKEFFRLHPPKGGFKKSTKCLYPKGVLGNQGKDINKLVMRML